ncbi:hypothetical protein, partial [Actinocorallia aurantiaca]|uniref:hypothetical protein n=1 Tax=Actinocorallia aurantiaca TaxID=46204 RepID=UPI0031D04001
MTDPEEVSPEAAAIVTELGLCRQRGLGDLDLKSKKQAPVSAEKLTALANEYCTAKHIELFGRDARIERLIADGLNAYKERGNQQKSTLI